MKLNTVSPNLDLMSSVAMLADHVQEITDLRSGRSYRPGH
jgi:hypothetical protein